MFYSRLGALSKLLCREIFSFPCPLCRINISENGSGFCSECLRRIPFLRPPLCPACGGENDGIFEVCGKCLKEEKRPWSKSLALIKMEGCGKELIHRYKYKNDTALARSLGHIAAERLNKSGMHADFIVPVPLHWTRQFFRGYNQAMLFSQILSQKTGIPVADIMKRTKRTPKQANLKRNERINNLKKAFSVKNREFCKNRIILLTDDVLTTGSTLSEASSELIDAGADKINILVLARG